MEDDDDVPELSASTLAVLQSFLREQESEQAHEKEAEEQETGGLSGAGSGEYEMVKENWGMSQFWYDADTSKTVADELHHLTADSRLPIACIACPSLYTQLKVSEYFPLNPCTGNAVGFVLRLGFSVVSCQRWISKYRIWFRSYPSSSRSELAELFLYLRHRLSLYFFDNF